MAAPKSVTDENLPAMLAEFWKLRQQNLSYEEMVPLLSKFWENGLSSAGALAQYIRTCKERPTTPQWFHAWMWGEDPEACPPNIRIAASIVPGKIRVKKSTPPKVSVDLDHVQPVVEADILRNTPSEPAPILDPALEELETLRAENSRLKAQVCAFTDGSGSLRQVARSLFAVAEWIEDYRSTC